MMQQKHTVYLGLGSNLGDRLKNIAAAISRLGSQVEVKRTSRVYETEPWGFKDQPKFLNQVLKGKTTLSPLVLLRYLKEAETQLGRTPGARYGPRVIDIDILFYDKEIMNCTDLCIPHPHLTERAFVLVPMAEIAPRFKHPILGKSMRELANQVGNSGVILFTGK